MRVTMTSAAARTGHANEDFTGAVPTAAVLIDGAGISGTESICRHGVAWYSNRLGGSLLGLLSLGRDGSLSTLLAEAIEQVTDEHRDTCDVANPISPSATVATLRLSDGLIEHLVLGDSVLVLDRAYRTPLVISRSPGGDHQPVVPVRTRGHRRGQRRIPPSPARTARQPQPAGRLLGGQGRPPGGRRGDHRKLPDLRADRRRPA
jgi:hypothetical protein